MNIFDFTENDVRAIKALTAILIISVFINLCSGYSEWAAGSQNNFIESCISFPIDINRCGRQELMALPGVGPAAAEKIINYRLENQDFKTRSEIKKIKGIGEKFYERIKDKIFVENDPTPDIEECMDLNIHEEYGIYKIDINAASVEDFQKIKGIGRKAGEKIIEFRQNNGGRIDSFKSLDAIEGIGKKRMKKLNKYFIIY